MKREIKICADKILKNFNEIKRIMGCNTFLTYESREIRSLIRENVALIYENKHEELLTDDYIRYLIVYSCLTYRANCDTCLLRSLSLLQRSDTTLIVNLIKNYFEFLLLYMIRYNARINSDCQFDSVDEYTSRMNIVTKSIYNELKKHVDKLVYANVDLNAKTVLYEYLVTLAATCLVTNNGLAFSKVSNFIFKDINYTVESLHLNGIIKGNTYDRKKLNKFFEIKYHERRTKIIE